jgi:hypothetical protein
MAVSQIFTVHFFHAHERLSQSDSIEYGALLCHFENPRIILLFASFYNCDKLCWMSRQSNTMYSELSISGISLSGIFA